MKYEAAKTVSRHPDRQINVWAGGSYEWRKDDKFEFFFNRLEKLLNSSISGRKNTPRDRMSCWKCSRRSMCRECQAITLNQENLTNGCLWEAEGCSLL
ncbi:hypothetical protein AVEN_195892-1 [Araneus ventricosus]|uniref:Uncharacterized protein n=1 Tax=Araneus ventricosus TaxID=182803 RepID=A0A4Y2DU04_ARAVE|nr:hypothetical protein AVEN_195892-1 [Araneus ventricosus]